MEEKYGHYNDDTEKKNRLGMNVVFGMIMIAIYLGMAYLLLFTSLFSNLYDIVRYIMGGVFAVYGVFRGYRFTGCDLDLFINFKKYFLNGKILKIQNTYRNSQELIDIAGSFVMQNYETDTVTDRRSK